MTASQDDEMTTVVLHGGPADGREFTIKGRRAVTGASFVVVPHLTEGGTRMESHRYFAWDGEYVGIDPEPEPYVPTEPTRREVIVRRLERALAALRGKDEDDAW